MKNRTHMIFLRILFVITTCLPFVSGQGVNPLSITRLSPTQFQLSWYANTLRPYQIENSPDLNTWTELTGYIEGTNTQQGVVVAKTNDKMFFRLKTGAMRSGFNTKMLDADDDNYSGLEPIGFPINVFPTIANPGPWTGFYVNNNGNITIGGRAGSYRPLPLQSSAQEIPNLVALIAPFWADVDTNPARYPATANGCKVVTYGQGFADGRPAFGVNWRDVGYYNQATDKLNSFQLILIDRSNIGVTGDFDAEFNYNQIFWETGRASEGTNGFGGKVARVGITNALNRTIEAEYSGETLKQLDFIPTGFPNAGTKNYTSGLIYRKRNITVPGRQFFQFRNGDLLDALQVHAGPDQSLGSGSTSVTLAGTASDPSGGSITVQWSVLKSSSITPVVFGNDSQLNTTVTFAAGAKTDLQLTVRRNLDPFAGDWVAMTGPGTLYLTTIGDSGDRGAGSFKTEVILLQGSYTFTEPPIGTPLALRFYDSHSIGASTYLNAVSDITGGFNWLAPADPDSLVGLGLSYLTAGVFWQDGSGSAFRTTIPIPEPSSFALLGIFGLGGLMVRRRDSCR